MDFQNQDNDDRVLTGVANGLIEAGSNQAVTGDQLDSVADALGGSQTFTDGRLAVSYTLSGAAYSNVGDALDNLDTRTTTNTEAIGTLSTTISTVSGNVSTLTTSISNGTIGLVQRDAATGVISVANTFGGTSVDFAGTDGARVLGGVASGSAATDAVNVGQLNAALSGVGGYAPVAANNTSALANPVATGANALAVGYGASAAGSNGFAAARQARRAVRPQPRSARQAWRPGRTAPRSARAAWRAQPAPRRWARPLPPPGTAATASGAALGRERGQRLGLRGRSAGDLRGRHGHRLRRPRERRSDDRDRLPGNCNRQQCLGLRRQRSRVGGGCHRPRPGVRRQRGGRHGDRTGCAGDPRRLGRHRRRRRGHPGEPGRRGWCREHLYPRGSDLDTAAAPRRTARPSS